MKTPETVRAGWLDDLERSLSSAYSLPISPALVSGVDLRIDAAIARRMSWNRVPGEGLTGRVRRPLGRAFGWLPLPPLRGSLSFVVVALLLLAVAVTAIGHMTSPGYFEPGGYTWRNAQQLALTRTVNGYGVTLKSVYADVNQLQVSVSVSVPARVGDADRIDPRLVVTDSAGVRWQEHTASFDPKGQVTEITYYFLPESGTVPHGARDLTFEVKGLQETQGTAGSSAAPVVFDTTFTAAVTFPGATEIAPAVSTSAAGATVTLDRVVISASMVEVDLSWSGLAAAPEGLAWTPMVEIRHDGELLDDFVGAGPTDGQTWVDRTAEGAEVAAGHWTVTVTQFWYDRFVDAGAAQSPPRVSVDGPWVMEFDVP